ncbi:MAG: DNA repair protein RadA [Lachnospiraceae bacterium]|nr:DNA repair protein RadA [Lachnospiraceae bacterium]MCR5409768.1 DNA repair protein RadA [Lachnospiraceae bacterium]
MAKSRSETLYFCKNCGHESAKWLGQCPSCHEWNTMTEAPKSASSSKSRTGRASSGAGGSFAGGPSRGVRLSEIELTDEQRMSSGLAEFDRVLGGGVVTGSLVLVGGDPGIGKSTILLQAARAVSETGKTVLYVSGEESEKQIKMRAMRIGDFGPDFFLLCDTLLDNAVSVMEEKKPDLVVIDSIQTMTNDGLESASGSVSQVRESTATLMRVAKGMGISIFIVGHVTKDGAVAGPKVLEHMVDTVLYFEGDLQGSYRILRAVKNRFGSTNEIGVFEMSQGGLKEVKNPSEYMLSGRAVGSSGNIVTCVMEGSRPLLIEIQALVTDNTSFTYPKRQAAGIDYNRVSLLMAVLEKRVGMRLAQSDAYVNIAGGMKVSEPSVDLAVVIAIASSFRNRPIDKDTVSFGEVGLSGEIRAVSMCERRVIEAQKLGFKRAIVPAANHGSLKDIKGMELIEVRTLDEVMDKI